MAVFAVGDIQGCLDELCAVLKQAGFRPRKDTLWCVGDLVNRGPKSLETLRFIRDLGSRAVCVLGNHDITLLALAAGIPIPARSQQHLQEILEAPDCDELIDWLRSRSLMHYDPELDYAMVHAGLLPEWSLKQALGLAGELEEFLRSDDWKKKIHKLYGPRPRRWKDSLSGFKRLRIITNVMTRLRYLDAEGRVDLDCKLSPVKCPRNLTPWFRAPARRTRKTRIIFGHWSTLGFYSGNNVWGIDTGCVWGRKLTVLRLDKGGPVPTQILCQQRALIRKNS